MQFWFIFSVEVTLTIFFPTVGIPCFSCAHGDCKVTGFSAYSGQNIYYKIKTSSAYSPQTNIYLINWILQSSGKSLGTNLVISYIRNLLKDG